MKTNTDTLNRIEASPTSRIHEARYTIAGNPDQDPRERFTLYAAAKILAELGRACKSTDATHIRRGGRVIGFWSNYHGTVRPTHYTGPRADRGARSDEQHALTMWKM